MAGVPEASLAWRPRGELAGIVDSVVDYRMPADPGRYHRGLPSPWLTVVLSYQDRVSVEMPGDDGLVSSRHRTLIGGLHRRAALLPQEDPQWGVQLAVAPLAAPALFGVSAAELASRVVDLHDVLGGRAGDLVDALAEARPGPERFTLIGEALRRQLRTASTAAAPRRELAHAWRIVVDTDGLRPVGTVADDVGWSRRHLSDRMRRATGLGPKDLARTARFQRSQHLIRGRADSLAGIAALCGYADQSHLTAEWRELAGCTPGAWIAEELPSLERFPIFQDDDATEGGCWAERPHTS